MRAAVMSLLAMTLGVCPFCLAPAPVAFGQPRVACLIPAQETQRCYPPREVIQAESLMPMFPVDPSAAVRAATGLSLTQVAVYRGPASDYLHVPAGVHGITYVFGRPPRLDKYGHFVFPTPRRPHFAIVNEGWYPGVTPGMFVWRVPCPPKGQPILAVHGIPDGCGPFWILNTALVSRQLAVSVETNTSARRATAIGRAIVAAGSRGK